jgi:hypothetical protein
MLRFLFLLFSLLPRGTPAQNYGQPSSDSDSSGAVETNNNSPSYGGSCCASLCCNSGYRSGSTIWWYRGYRPSQQEGDNFQQQVNVSSGALDSLLALNSTNATLVNECATLDANQTTLLDTETNTTLESYLQTFGDRLEILQEQFDSEIDTYTDIQELLYSFERIQPCLENFQSQSDLHATRVLTVQEEVSELGTLTETWEAALGNSSGPNMASWGAMMASIVVTLMASSATLW